MKPWEERRKELGIFSLGKRRLREERKGLFKDLKGSPTKKGLDQSSIVPEYRIHNNRRKRQNLR